MAKKARKELQTVEAFEKALREEMEISSEFDLPLTVLALVIEGGWQEDDTRRTLDALRIADLVARPDPRELLIALPNSKTADAHVVQERLRRAVPKASIGVAPRKQSETAEGLLKHARAAARQTAEDPEATC